MEPEVFVDVFRLALGQVVILVSAAIIPSLLVGLIVAIFQAATSINEQTLSFLPRLLVTLASLMIAGHWFTGKLMELFFTMVDMIPQVVG
ncbi:MULTISPECIES: flagellar biosynthetic protein FliQ [unclassified Agarivorans]|uniref:flagellar biosynthetic protein FliQ n=1 Tax=unclassified Agarivorans TaxID=2636026 RepID=UPI0026E44B48|nr:MULTISPECIES: flagellar biosynthetic protein FliQ [unclassified Agarivorans]MDO6686218.1 flagellar biosynthetic protein FliQ [Agarivorans sp. 3_MG-2023]MDO6716333.1 flagellar biosynthetic protein FliQ [Agarivorans sp. 2_MG-2023]MDO6764751.1 flagellar biosynthetic protein FliQ [Agarivorans sp. 1_MG-2023]